jgi:hypothetical protein
MSTTRPQQCPFCSSHDTVERRGVYTYPDQKPSRDTRVGRIPPPHKPFLCRSCHQVFAHGRGKR